MIVTTEFLSHMNWYGMELAHVRIGDRYYVYRFSFPEQVWTTQRMLHYSTWRGVHWAKKNAADCHRVSATWPVDCTPADMEKSEWPSASSDVGVHCPAHQQEFELV